MSPEHRWLVGRCSCLLKIVPFFGDMWVFSQGCIFFQGDPNPPHSAHGLRIALQCFAHSRDIDDYHNSYVVIQPLQNQVRIQHRLAGLCTLSTYTNSKICTYHTYAYWSAWQYVIRLWEQLLSYYLGQWFDVLILVPGEEYSVFLMVLPSREPSHIPF